MWSPNPLRRVDSHLLTGTSVVCMNVKSPCLERRAHLVELRVLRALPDGFVNVAVGATEGAHQRRVGEVEGVNLHSYRSK